MILDLKTIKAFYETNIQKGYTIEQITNHLRNNKYPAYQLGEAIKLLDVYFIKMSQDNPKKFDYSKLPDSIKTKITLPKQGVSQTISKDNSKLPLPEMLSGMNQIEKHPGLEGDTLFKFIGIIGGIVVVILIVLLIMVNGNNNSSTSLNGEDEFDSTFGTTQDDSLQQLAGDVSDVDLGKRVDSENEINLTSDEPEDGPEINQSEENETISNSSFEESSSNSLSDSTSFKRITPLPFIDTSQIICEGDDDCNDNNPMTKDSCISSACRHSLYTDPNDFCIPYDGHCREACYGYNDTDCVDDEGRVLCLDDDDCNDWSDLTEDLCDNHGGYCLYFPVSPRKLNHPPEIISEPNETTLFELELFKYQVEANDSDSGTHLTFELKGEPKNMTINETTGLIMWIPPATGNVQKTYDFTIKVSDEFETVKQDITLVVLMSETSDSLKQECGDSETCYENTVVALQEHLRCEYLGVYWEDEGFTHRDNCVFKIAYANKNLDLCQFIHDASVKTTCLSIK